MDKEEILDLIPCTKPYKYVDDILSLDEHHILGKYIFRENEFFYEGHFPNNPITPGAILLESAAQTGLLAFGMYLQSKENKKLASDFFLVSSDIQFKKVVKPNEAIYILSEKIFFRLNKLKCKIRISTVDNEVICKGIISGMVID